LDLLVVTHFYPPELGAAARRMGELTDRLATEQGIRVTVTTGPPRYLLRSDGAPPPPSAVEVVRVPSFIPTGSDVRRVLDYAAVAAGTAFRWSLSGRRFDAVLATVPPLTTGLAGLWASRALRAPLLLDVRDLWPEEPMRAGLLRPDSPTGRVAEGLAGYVIPRADAWTVACRGIAEGIVRRGVDRRRVAVVPNTPIESLLEMDPLPSLKGKAWIVYAGLMGRAQGLEVLLDAAERLAGEPGLGFLMLGDGVERPRLESLAAQRGLRNMHFAPPAPPDEVVETIRRSAAVVSCLRPGHRATIPAKLWEGMALARPLLVAAEGDAAELVRSSGAGAVVPPGDGASLAEAVRDRLAQGEAWEEMGRRGREHVRRLGGRGASAAALAALLHELSAGGAR
jgi:glycosyltransferase involved in cell wall biosynthesis